MIIFHGKIEDAGYNRQHHKQQGKTVRLIGHLVSSLAKLHQFLFNCSQNFVRSENDATQPAEMLDFDTSVHC